MANPTGFEGSCWTVKWISSKLSVDEASFLYLTYVDPLCFHTASFLSGLSMGSCVTLTPYYDLLAGIPQ